MPRPPAQRDDRRSPQAATYRAWYRTKEWRALRREKLALSPWCENCRKRGLRVRATVVHHRKRHQGMRELFFCAGNLEALCAPCHDGPAQSAERLGYRTDVGPDGLPTDPRHPFNR